MDKGKLLGSHFTWHMCFVFSSEICEIFKNTFENTNNSVEDLRTGTCVECYLKIVDFVIISYIVI